MKRWTELWLGVVMAAAGLAIPASADGLPPVFPLPRESSSAAGDFVLDQNSIVAITASPSQQDLFLARMLVEELGDRFDLHLKIERLEHLAPARKLIVMGAFSNPLVAEYCAGHALKVDARNPGPEGYILRTSPEIVVVAGSDDSGAFYGLQSLRQLAVERSGALHFAGY